MASCSCPKVQAVSGLRQIKQQSSVRQFVAVPRRQQFRKAVVPRAGLELDWTDPDTLLGAFGAITGLAVGIGLPLFFISRDEKDEKRLQELRELNRANFKETGEYLTEARHLFGLFFGVELSSEHVQ